MAKPGTASPARVRSALRSNEKRMSKIAKLSAVAVVVLALMGGCGDAREQEPVRGTSATATSTAAPTAARAERRQKRRKSSARATATPTSVATAASSPRFVSCDANIDARAANTTCPFAQNVFYEYYRESLGYPTAVSVQAWSPAAGRFYSVRCTGGSAISCRAGDGAEVKFPSGAVAAYDDDQAAAYASTHDTGRKDDLSEDYGDPADDGADDVDEYQDDEGDDYAAPDGPDEGNRIPNYDDGTGYPVQCADGMWSQSGGRPGACSHHGGVG
jgi:hypothetical protein